MEKVSSKYLDKYKRLGTLTASLVLVLSILVLIGWSTGNYALVRLIPDPGLLGFGETSSYILPLLGQLNSTSALILIALAASFYFVSGKQIVWRLILGRLLASIALVGCMLGIYGEVTGEELLSFRILRPEPSAPGITFPNPIMIPEAICLALVALAALSFVLHKKYSAICQVLAIISTTIPLLILFGFATGSPKLCSMGACFQLSLAFSILILLAASSILFASSEHGFLTIFSSTTIGGRIIRRASILFLVVPFLMFLRFLVVNININGYPLIETGLSWALFGLIFVALAGWLTYDGAKLAESADIDKTQTDKKLEEIRSGNQSRSFSKICIECGKEYDSTEFICPVDGAPLSESHKLNLIGKTFADKYKIVKQLGEGGMSSVYLAKHLILDRDFAIKVLKKSVISSKEDIERFKREAKIASKINHESIVNIQDFGISKDGLPYIAMEYITGMSLEELMDRQSYLTPEETFNILKQISNPLGIAHSLGIVHRDLKASNIMLVGDLQGKFKIKIVDFGIAKIISSDQNESQNLTLTGEALGSPLYMSPEQCNGLAVDQRSDIYSIACLTYYMLVGVPPFVGATVNETMAAHLVESPPAIPTELGIHESVQKTIFKALSKNPSDRHYSIQNYINELSRSFARI